MWSLMPKWGSYPLEKSDRRFNVVTVGEEDSERLVLEAPPGQGLHPVQHRLQLGGHVAPVHGGRPDDQVSVNLRRVDLLHIVYDGAAVVRRRLA
jgi:hypothetical protein